MATSNPNFTPPVASKNTELYYATEEDTGLVQVFGVQSIPQIITTAEDITYRTLESDTEFSTPGVRPYETIEIETLYYKEQFTALKTVEKSGESPWWYVKLPNASAPSGGKPTVIKWRGALSVAMSAIELDDMVRSTLKIGKSTEPTELEGLPSASSI